MSETRYLPTAFPRRPRPRVFTKQEQFIESLREALLTSEKNYSQLARLANVANSTVHNIASGKTTWPRHTTLFPLLAACKLRLAFVAE
jgi:predicted transcriptional regulator